MQKAIEAPHVHCAVLGDRRNGVERLSLIGTLDRSTLTLLEDEVATLSHVDGALVLDLRNLVEVDVDAVRALMAMARRAAAASWLLFVVHCRGSVREAFVREGASDLISADVSTVLSPGDGAWESISLPPLPGQRGSSRHRIQRERSETC